MCTNYEPYLDANFVRRFGAELPAVIFKPEAYPGYEAPVIRNIIRKAADKTGEVECIAARFGLVPYWAKPEDAEKAKMPFGTHNARSETVGEKASFKHAWRNRQFCLIPMYRFTSRAGNQAKPCVGKCRSQMASRLLWPAFGKSGNAMKK